MITNGTMRGKPVRIITQQYIVGLYVAVYKDENPIPEQMCLDTQNELLFHKNVSNGKVFKNFKVKKEVKNG